MKNLHVLLVCAAFWVISCREKADVRAVEKTAESNGYTYTYVTNDPLNVRVYTLKNGLQVWLSANPHEPRIQGSIAVKAGGKNDPADNTGLAHYLEHMMFKGTTRFGTTDWDAERILLDSIERMFNRYATLTEPGERKDYYTLIDQVSNEASKYAIPNEYDKMTAAIGATGTNAYTSPDRTVYVIDIPSNQLENWLIIESERFKTIVNRLFHTELEAVYEEKNRSLDNDYYKTFDALLGGLFPDHPYGTQTTLGTIDHLKNPSITAIKKYFSQYYAPDNVGICLSGDFDYDQTIQLIDQYFGDWKTPANLNRPVIEPGVVVLEKPKEVEVLGPFEEWVWMGFKFDGYMSDDYRMVKLVDMLLANSAAGLIDLNLVQKQKVLEGSCFPYELNDHTLHIFTGSPREGQTLEEVKELLLSQIELIKQGDFDDWLIDAVINDFKRHALEASQNNESRSDEMVVAFTNNVPRVELVREIDEMKKITREQIIAFVNEHYNDNYAVVYKRTGQDPNSHRVEKPVISKVTLNRENRSDFQEKLMSREVSPLTPVFVDFNANMKKIPLKPGVEVLYTQNNENELFKLYYLTLAGTNEDPRRGIAIEYLQYLGTDSLSAEDFKKELYKLGCSFDVSVSDEQTYVVLTGLAENMTDAMILFEQLLDAPKADDEALENMIEGILKEREDNKKNKNLIFFSGLLNYGMYGAESPFTNVLSNAELRALTSDELLTLIREITTTEHRVLYYGPETAEALVQHLTRYHKLPEELKAVPTATPFEIAEVADPIVYWTDYDMVQTEIALHTRAPIYDASLTPRAVMYNEYFGGNMSSIVFQEIREARGLAYAVGARYQQASKKDQFDRYFAYVGTQADKQAEAMEAFLEIIREMPESETQLETARRSIMNQIESERITREGILFQYLSAEKRGIDYDIRKAIYDEVPSMTLDQVKEFQEKYVKTNKHNIMLIGSRDRIDFRDLQKYGTVKELTLDEIFGYEKETKINLETPAQSQ